MDCCVVAAMQVPIRWPCPEVSEARLKIPFLPWGKMAVRVEGNGSLIIDKERGRKMV